MKLLYRLFFLSLSAILLTTGCNRGAQPVPDKDFFQDEVLHYVLYIDPDSDCRACFLTALEMLEKINREKGRDELNIIALKSASTGYFVDDIKEKYKNVNFILVDHSLQVPHPSVLIIKKRHLLLYVYLPVDPFVMKDILDKMEAITTNFFFNFESPISQERQCRT